MSQNSLNNQTYDADFIAFRQPASAGTTCFIAANHTDTTNAGSTAQVVAQSTAASGADAFHISALASTRAWCHGIDASDGASLKEATQAGGSTSPSTGTVTRKVTTAGEQTMPLQPVFIAGATLSVNATGDGTLAQVLYGGAVTQQGSSYNAGTSLFTCPVTGWYAFDAQVILGGLTVAHTSGNLGFLINGGASFQCYSLNPTAIQTGLGTGLNLPMSMRAFFNAGDTVGIYAQVFSGALVVSTAGSFFSGSLIC